jgi:uncharacterized OB-fold protein
VSIEPFLPTRAPRRTLETAAFWDGCAEGRVVLPKCDACGELIWYPREFCPFCASTSVTNTELSGHGTVYSFTIMRRGSGPFSDRAPYVVAMVTLQEGPTVMTNIVGVDPMAVFVGQAVTAVFDRAGDDAILRFTPTAP